MENLWFTNFMLMFIAGELVCLLVANGIVIYFLAQGSGSEREPHLPRKRVLPRVDMLDDPEP